MTYPSFTIDIDAIRQQARRDMRAKALAGAGSAGAKAVIDVLNDVLATEIVCWARYSRHASVAAGTHRDAIAAKFTGYAATEMRYAVIAAERICQLGGVPDFDPRTLAARPRASCEVASDEDLPVVLIEDLAANRIVISTYQEVIGWLGGRDLTTRRMLESILARQEAHTTEILSLLNSLEAARS